MQQLKQKVIEMSVNPLLQVQKVNLPEDTLRFITPCSISISGPSQSIIIVNHLDPSLLKVLYVFYLFHS